MQQYEDEVSILFLVFCGMLLRNVCTSAILYAREKKFVVRHSFQLFIQSQRKTIITYVHSVVIVKKFIIAIKKGKMSLGRAKILAHRIVT